MTEMKEYKKLERERETKREKARGRQLKKRFN